MPNNHANKLNVLEIEFQNKAEKKKFLAFCNSHLEESVSTDRYGRSMTEVIFLTDVEKDDLSWFNVLSARDIELSAEEN